MNPEPSLGIFIPAYNAESTLPAVLARIPVDLWPRLKVVAVIDDGSADQTAERAQALAAAMPKIQVHTSARNQGYGLAVRRGLGVCREAGCEIAVCLHADGQYPPERIGGFADHMLQNRLDLLQGSRHLAGHPRAGGMPRYKVVAGKALTWVENRCLGHRLTDPHSGFLLYGRRALRNIPFEKLSGYFDFDLEVIACAAALGLRIDELPIPARYAGERSYLNPLRYGFCAVRMAARYRLGYYHRVDPRPRR